MKNIISYIMMAIMFVMVEAQQGDIQCRCRTHITNSVVQTGGQKLCGQKGGILSSNSQLCTNLSQNFTDTDCQAFGDSFFATCGTARSPVKRGIYKREVTPIQTRPKRGWQWGREPVHLLVSRRPIPERFSKN
ncbi:uncharacterized protein N0V96_010677 [Colletotrichum fioriniae]|uniref:uncharacterized protein n=1 Tax=Colletotrichum fioriniae TaxID=710243 RepID=UPI0023012A08|nr:uncharacterized protein COL516b_002234 [Colletotrichum fioriniae]KAJ0310432.1 hypothetical protein COL516b_002234 [Colletotrichum fioriniae]KAJ3939231.1 hypothetical protein N0V96_010677 [Colletotrichum fioriniae]